MISIDKLPDDALHVIFDHYLHGVRLEGERKRAERAQAEKAWQSLVHVCRQWRRIVFESPRRLDLWLVCTGKSPVKDRLDVWPALPLIILGEGDSSKASTRSMSYVDNIVATFEHTNRVCQINLVDFKSPEMERFLATMQKPFPALTNLCLRSNDETQVVPDSFLGGSAPLLEVLTLSHIPFPGLPNLLLSATHLRNLTLHIPRSGYFPPDAIVTVLSTLTSLDFLELKFISPRSCPDRESRRPPLSTRSVIPVLTHFVFKGVSEYLEDLVACIDAPKLGRLQITFFNDIIFDAPQLIQFISRTPKLKALKSVGIFFSDNAVNFSSHASLGEGLNLTVEILCKGLDWQLSSLERVCTSCLPPLSTLEDLYFYDSTYLQPDRKDDIDNELWVELLRPFSAVKNLYLAKDVASHVASVFQELVEGRMREVLPMILPTLRKILLREIESSGPVQEGIVQFVAARQVAGHPITVSHWAHYSI